MVERVSILSLVNKTIAKIEWSACDNAWIAYDQYGARIFLVSDEAIIYDEEGNYFEELR